MTDTEAREKREKSVCDIVTFPHWEAGETKGGNLCDTGTVGESIISSRYNRSLKQLYDSLPREFWRENRRHVCGYTIFKFRRSINTCQASRPVHTICF